MFQLAALFLAGSLAALEAPRVDYRVALVDPAQKRVDVTARVSGFDARDGVLELRMPEGYAFIRFPEPLLDGPVAARANGVELEVEHPEPYAWRVHTNGAHDFELAYSVPLTHREVPAVKERDTYEHPYVESDHAMLVCGAIFIAPAVEHFDAHVRFDLPDGWPALTPWPEIEPGAFAPARRHDLEDGLIALGHWNTSDVAASGARVTIAFAPSEAEFASVAGPLVERIVASELELFASKPFERFLFLFVPSDVRGFAGSAKGGAMVLSLKHGIPATALAPQLGHLVAHEFFHTWATAHYHAPDALRFVNEGFTDYFANLVLARSGVTSWDEFAKTLGDAIAKYERAASATRTSLIDAGGPKFFEGRDAYEQIYSGGLLIAALCDLAVRSRANEPTNLDALMREFNNDSRWSPGVAAPSLEVFSSLLAKRASSEFAQHVSDLLQRETTIDFAAELDALGCRVEIARAPAKLELRANFAGLRIVDIDPKCAAAAIGLRAGDELIEVNGRAVKSQREALDAFKTPSGDRLRVKLRRDGAETELDQPIPVETTRTIDVAPWRS